MSDAQQTPAEEFLAHYGVRGMKWGVRKARTGNLGTRAARQRRYASGESKKAGGARRIIDTASAVSNYRVNDLVKGRGLHRAAARRADVLDAERKRLATGKAKTTDVLKAYGQVAATALQPMGIPTELVRVGLTGRDSKRKNDNNRPV